MAGGEPGAPIDWLRAQLLERRIVLLRGPIDDEAATRVAAELTMLDWRGDEPIELHLDSEGGALRPALTVIDTIDALRAEVHATCVGRAEGAAVGVFAAGRRRLIAPHARLHLCEPRREGSGHAGDLRQLADQAAADLAAVVERVARACGRPAEHVEAEMVTGCWLDAEGAVTYGLADAIRR